MVFGEYKSTRLLENDKNDFDKVQDFNWHKKTPSPHFKITREAMPNVDHVDLMSLNTFIQSLK